MGPYRGAASAPFGMLIGTGLGGIGVRRWLEDGGRAGSVRGPWTVGLGGRG